MDPVSVTLTVLLIIWGLIGVFIGNLTLKRQRTAAENAQRSAYLANLGASRLQQVQMFIQEYEPLLNRQDVDKAVFEGVLRKGYGLLNTIVDEASEASEDLQNNSLANIQNFFSAFYMLKNFVKSGLDEWQRRLEAIESESMSDPFQDEETLSEPQPEELVRDASAQLKRADTAVREVRRRVTTAT